MKSKKSYNRYSYVNNKKIKKLQRTIDLMAYGSLLLDIFIAIITGMSLFNITSGEAALVPIHYMLTLVVIMSLASGGLLLYIKHYEKVMAELLRIKYKIKIGWIPSPRTRHGWKWYIKRKLNEFKKLKNF